MARIVVDSYAFDDPRFDHLAALLSCIRDADHARGRCLRIWHHCASRSVDSIRPAELAQCLGLKRFWLPEMQERAVHAFCTADLGELQADGTVKVRGTEGRTDYVKRLKAARQTADELPERLLESLRTGPMTKKQLRLANQDVPRSTFYAAVAQLVADGAIIQDGKQVRLTADHHPSPSNAQQQRQAPASVQKSPETVHGQSGTHLLVLVPDPVSVQRESSLSMGPIQEKSKTSPMDILERTDVVPFEERRQVAKVLWRYQNERRRGVVDSAPDVPLSDHPGGTLDEVIRRLAIYSPAQLAHAVDMLALEAAHLNAKGHDGLRFLNGVTNWKDSVVARWVATTKDELQRRFAEGYERLPTKRAEPPRKLKDLTHAVL